MAAVECHLAGLIVPRAGGCCGCARDSSGGKHWQYFYIFIYIYIYKVIYKAFYIDTVSKPCRTGHGERGEQGGFGELHSGMGSARLGSARLGCSELGWAELGWV